LGGGEEAACNMGLTEHGLNVASALSLQLLPLLVLRVSTKTTQPKIHPTSLNFCFKNPLLENQQHKHSSKEAENFRCLFLKSNLNRQHLLNALILGEF
jgi:hypothetical protein